MLATSGGFVGTAAAGNTAPDCNTVSYTGSGTSSDPYEVGNVDQLQCIENQGLGNHYELTSDIDASGTSQWNGGSGFDPIGNSSSEFTGTFDGADHTISGLTITRGSTDNVGLFGVIDDGSTVENVGLDTVSINGSSTVGGLVGESYRGTVRGSYVSGSVNGSSTVGGLVGYNDGGSVSKSYVSGRVDGSGDNIGGLVGLINRGGTVSQSYASGSVAGAADVGGLVGKINDGEVSKLYATSTVSATGTVGGIVGDLAYSSADLKNSYWDKGTTNQGDAVGANSGDVSGVQGFGSTGDTSPAPEMQGSSATSKMGALDFDSTWETVENSESDTTGDGYPILQSVDRQAQLEAQNVNAYNVTTSDGTAETTRSDPVTVDDSLSIGGPDVNIDAARVTIQNSKAGDTLTVTENYGITGSYDSSTGVLSLSGTASLSEYEEVLRSVEFENTNDDSNTDTTEREITFSLGNSVPSEDTGHYYEFVSDGTIDWDDAKSEAAGKSYFGLQGYLVTVTSQDENNFVKDKLQGQGWMGATDRASEGTWKWVTGPEDGDTFPPSNSPDQSYDTWASGEPNDAGGEDRAHFLTDGQWNDYANDNNNIDGYVVEYGGFAADPNVDLRDTRNVALTAAPSVSSITRADSNPTDADSVDFDVTFSESVSGVDTSDFTVTQVSGDVSGSVSGVSGSGSSYTITLSSIADDGDLRLDLSDDGSITSDSTGFTLGGPGTSGDNDGSYTSDEAYTIDNTAPSLTDDSGSTDEETAGTIVADLLSNDNEPTALTVTKVKGSAGNVGTAVTGSNNGKFTIDSAGQVDFDPNGAFESLANTASDTTQVTVTVADDAGNTDTQTVTATVTGVNDAPSLSDTSVTLSPIDEDTPAPTGSSNGAVVSSLVSLASNVDDPEDNTPGIALTSATGSDGTWHYYDGSTWQTVGSVSDSNALLLTDTDRIAFEPDQDFNGVVDPAVTFRAWDQTRASAGTRVDTTTNGKTTAYSSSTDTASLTVDALNDAPSFSLPTDPDQSVGNDTSRQTNTSFIDTTTFDPGGGSDESAQSLSDFLVSNDNNTLFDTQPDIANSGDLTYTPADGVDGTATVSVQVTDDGGTSNGGNDTSASKSFTLSVDNRAPSISSFGVGNPSGQDVTVSFDSDDQLSMINVSISGAESATLNQSDFTETDNGGSYTYEATYSGSSDGTYDVSLDTAEDAIGNDGASGESDSVDVSTGGGSDDDDDDDTSSSTATPTQTDTPTSTAIPTQTDTPTTTTTSTQPDTPTSTPTSSSDGIASASSDDQQRPSGEISEDEEFVDPSEISDIEIVDVRLETAPANSVNATSIITLENPSTEDQTVDVRFVINGEVVEQREVVVPAEQRINATHSEIVEKSGMHEVASNLATEEDGETVRTFDFRIGTVELNENGEEVASSSAEPPSGPDQVDATDGQQSDAGGVTLALVLLGLVAVEAVILGALWRRRTD